MSGIAADERNRYFDPKKKRNRYSGIFSLIFFLLSVKGCFVMYKNKISFIFPQVAWPFDDVVLAYHIKLVYQYK